MTEVELEIRKLESTNEMLEVAKGKWEALVRLGKNKDFSAIVNESYLREEAIRLAYSKAHPNMQGDKDQAAITRDIDSIGSLYQYFNTIITVGMNAESEIANNNVEISALRSAEIEEEMQGE